MFISASNTASVGVPEKIGLRREVDQKGEIWVDGIGWDGWLVWGVLAEEWDCGKHELITRAWSSV